MNSVFDILQRVGLPEVLHEGDPLEGRTPQDSRGNQNREPGPAMVDFHAEALHNVDHTGIYLLLQIEAERTGVTDDL